MALSLTRDLSLIDFIGKEDDLSMLDGEEGINVFAFVCEFAASRLREVEDALKKRQEAKKKAAEDRIKLRRRLTLNKQKMMAKKKARRPKEERPLPHHAESSSSMRPQRRRRPIEYLDEIRSGKRARPSGVAAGATDLLGLQDIHMEPNLLKRKKAKADDSEKPKKKPREAAGAADLLGLQDIHMEPNLLKRKKAKAKADESEKPKKKPRVAAAPADTGPDPPPGLPESFRERIQNLGGRNPVLVIQKRLFKTDVAKQQNRLSIPRSSLKTEFLEDHERALLDGRLGDGHCKALKPKILDATGEDRIISLRKWDMKKDNGSATTIVYNLNKPWYDMVKANGWEAGDLVQVWAFRVEEELGLAIVKLEEN